MTFLALYDLNVRNIQDIQKSSLINFFQKYDLFFKCLIFYIHIFLNKSQTSYFRGLFLSPPFLILIFNFFDFPFGVCPFPNTISKNKKNTTRNSLKIFFSNSNHTDQQIDLYSQHYFHRSFYEQNSDKVLLENQSQ